MGKFKEFIVEQVGLGDLGPRINKVFHGPDLGNQIGGALLHPAWSGSDTTPTHMDGGLDPSKPPVDLTIPSIQSTGRITCLMLKKNPIYVRLSDGTECNFSYDEFKRIQGKPEIGKVMTVVFQRHPQDAGPEHSKIDKAIVHN